MDPKHSHGPDRLDYKETSDLTEVHAAIQREHAEPTAEVTPIPLWLTAVCGFAICWAGVYLGLFHGGFRGDIFNERLSSPDLLFPAASKNAAAPAKEPTLADQGKGLYSNNCVACHQANAKGLPGQFPPLAKSEWVNGSEKRFVAILLKGVHGPLTVEGTQINSEAMLAWEGVFNDKKLAALATFLRSNFENNAPEISEAKVKAARAEFAAQKDKWTEAQLLQIPADATLPDAAGAAPAAPAAPAGQAPAAVAAPGAPAASAAPAATAPADAAKLIATGKATYMTLCVVCHQPTGMGLFPVFPPLTKSPYVNGPAERLVAMVLKGNMGPMTIDGKPFNNIMPPQEAVLTDDKIAAVTSYVRSTFGNSAPPVPQDVVAATRKKFLDRKTSWTQAELDAWK